VLTSSGSSWQVLGFGCFFFVIFADVGCERGVGGGGAIGIQDGKRT